VVSDAEYSDTTDVVIVVTPVNDAPVITSLNTASATEDTWFSYLGTATDVEDSTLSWVFDLMPSWLTAQADSVFGVPLEGAADTTFRAIVSDESLSDTSIVAITITAVNDDQYLRPSLTAAFLKKNQLW
jgi:hypothetical protein